MINILMVDDHAIVREGLRRIIEEKEEIKIVFEAATGEEAVDFISKEASFKIDLNLGKLGNDNSVLNNPLFVRVPDENILENNTPFCDNSSKFGVILLVSPSTPV